MIILNATVTLQWGQGHAEIEINQKRRSGPSLYNFNKRISSSQSKVAGGSWSLFTDLTPSRQEQPQNAEAGEFFKEQNKKLMGGYSRT